MDANSGFSPSGESLLNRTSIEPHSTKPIINCQEDEYSATARVGVSIKPN